MLLGMAVAKVLAGLRDRLNGRPEGGMDRGFVVENGVDEFVGKDELEDAKTEIGDREATTLSLALGRERDCRRQGDAPAASKWTE